MDVSAENSARQLVSEWQSRCNPQVQGTNDSKLLTSFKGITHFERQLVESFNKEMKIFAGAFKKKDLELCNSLNRIEQQIKINQEKHGQLNVGEDNRDSTNMIHPTLVKAVYVASFLFLSVFNYFFLSSLKDILLILRALLGILLSLMILATCFFAGRLIRNHDVKKMFIGALGLSTLSILIIFFTIIYHSRFDATIITIALLNLCVFIMVAITTYFTDMLKPREHTETIDYLKNIERLKLEQGDIAGERELNLVYYTSLQNIFVAGAQETVKTYRRHLHNNRVENREEYDDDGIMPEFKPSVLHLTEDCKTE